MNSTSTAHIPAPMECNLSITSLQLCLGKSVTADHLKGDSGTLNYLSTQLPLGPKVWDGGIREIFPSLTVGRLMSKSPGGDNINSQQGAESVRQGADTTKYL